MSGQIAWGKFLLFTGAIMAAGWGIMTVTTPTEDQFYNSLSPELKRKMDAVRAQRAGNTSSVKDQLASAGAEDKVVWGDQLGAVKPPPAQTNRRV